LEAPAAWKAARLAQKSFSNSGGYESRHQISMWYDGLGTSTPIRETHSIQILDKAHRTYSRRYSSTNTSDLESLIVVNPGYNFELSRGAEESLWSVTALYLPDNDPSKDPLHEKVLSDNELGDLTNITRTSFPGIVLDGQRNIEFKTAKRVSYSGIDAVRCVLTISVPIVMVDTSEDGIAKEVQRPTECECIFDPSMDWAVLECTLTLDSLKMIAKYSYERTSTRAIYGSRTHEEQYVDGARTEWRTIDSSIRNLPLMQSDFTLSAYGFPEPDGYSPPRPWWLYTSVVGVVIFLVGIVVMKLGRRLQRH
jgi:hypothetical protein